MSTHCSEEHSAGIFGIGELGHVLEVKVGKADEKGKFRRSEKLIVVIDRSGSMYSMIRRCQNGLVKALEANGMANEDEFELITFSSDAKKVKTTLSEFRRNQITTGGATYMAPAVELLGSSLKSFSKKTVANIIVISDGEIKDRKAMQNVATGILGTYVGEVNMFLIRLYEGTNNADTGALATLACLATGREAPPCIDAKPGELENILRENLLKPAKISFPDMATASRVPGGENANSVLYDKTTYLLVDRAVQHIFIDRRRVQVKSGGEITSEHSIQMFLANILDEAKLWALGGIRKKDLCAIIRWADHLDQYFKTLAKANNETSTYGVSARARRIAMEVKSSKSLLREIQELKNFCKVQNLNAQQQAEWLREVGTNKSGRALARRADSEWEEKFPSAIDALVRKTESIDIVENEETSYYSKATTLECLQSARELQEVSVLISASNVLQCIGAVGIPIKARKGNYVDPWTFRVSYMYVGSSLRLAECDLWLMKEFGKNVKCPGFEGIITGVIGIDSGSGAYSYYSDRESKVIMEMQASAQMRGTIAPVEFDSIALTTAGLWWLLEQKTELSSAQKEAFDDLKRTLETQIGKVYKAHDFRSMFIILCTKHDVRPFLSSAFNIGNVLRPIASLLRFGTTECMSREQVSHVIRALYGFESYHKCKRHFFGTESGICRDEALCELLDAKMDQVPALQPLFEPDLQFDDVVFNHDGIDIDHVMNAEPIWAPDTAGYESLAKLLGHPEIVLDNATKAVLWTQAIQCKHAYDRIDSLKLVCHLQDVRDELSALDFLNDVKHQIFVKMYVQKVSEKSKKEEMLKLDQLVNSLVQEKQLSAFKNSLKESKIDNHNHLGCTKMIDQLLSKSDTDLVDLKKLAILITGRKIKDPSIVLWNRGNVLTGDWSKFERHFAKHNGQQIFAKMMQTRLDFGARRYRDGPKNRHGHSNEFRSFFGLGYESMLEMKAKVSTKAWQKYLLEHCIEAGCCYDIKIDAELESFRQSLNV